MSKVFLKNVKGLRAMLGMVELEHVAEQCTLFDCVIECNVVVR